MIVKFPSTSRAPSGTNATPEAPAMLRLLNVSAGIGLVPVVDVRTTLPEPAENAPSVYSHDPESVIVCPFVVTRFPLVSVRSSAILKVDAAGSILKLVPAFSNTILRYSTFGIV